MKTVQDVPAAPGTVRFDHVPEDGTQVRRGDQVHCIVLEG